MFSIDGLVSGFETSTIIESLLGFQQAQIDTFNSRKAEIATEQTSFKGVEAQLLTLKGSLGQLNRTRNSVFDVSAAVSSNEDILTVAADSGASPSVYQLSVESLATAHQVASQGLASASEQIATGDLTFKVGDRAAQTISIDQSNNTLPGLVTTINEQLKDVSASVIYDQASDTHRILLSSKHTGADNQITVTSGQDAGTGVVPDFSGPAIQEAANAVIQLGSGPGALTTEYATNQIDGLIDGVTIDLKSASPGTTVTIDVSKDNTAAREAIENFVTDFNAVIEFIEAQTRFNPDTNQASPLLGNRSVSTVKDRLFAAVTNTISVSGGVSRLSQIGVDFNAQGRLVIDSEKLNNALDGELNGVDPSQIRNLFGLNASSTNAGIEFLTGGTRTKDSLVPYQVDITRAAERAAITATSALGASIDIDENNNTLQVTLDGIVSENLTLSAGTYTPEELAAHVQNTINSSDELGVHKVIVSLSESNELVFTSESYGSASQVSSVSGSASSVLGFDGSENDSGENVAGVFIVNGVEEVANGSGRLLIGDPENEHTADLQLRVTLSNDQIVDGSDGDVQVSRGATAILDGYITDILDGENGLFKFANDDFEARLASIDQSIERVETITESKREYLVREFTALESIMSQLQTTSSFITTQLASLGSFGGSNNKSS